MTNYNVTVHQHFDLGKIKIVDSRTRFPWEFFGNGEINCVFQTENSKNMNSIRIWINEHVQTPVYIEQERFDTQSCIIAFTDPEDAIKFALKFGDIIANKIT